MTRIFRFLILSSCLLVAACGGSSGGGGTGGTGGTGGSTTGGTPNPQPFPVGNPTEAPSTATIGAEGGTLTSNDGRFEIVIPAGAVGAPTDFSITALDSQAPSSVFPAYRVEPSTTLAVPATVTFYWDDTDIGGSLPEATNIAYQDPNGYWRVDPAPVVDTLEGSTSVQTGHFTDWSLIEMFELTPAKTTVKPGGTVSFELDYCSTLDHVGSDGDVLYGLYYDCGTDLWPLGTSTEWSATAGSVDDYGHYTAPSAVPNPNPDIVTVRVTENGALHILLAEVLVEDSTGFSGVINHESVNPGMAFEAKVEGTLYVESQDQSTYYAMKGTITVTTPVDTGDVCTLTTPSTTFDTTTTTLMRVDPNDTYTFWYVLTLESPAHCVPKDGSPAYDIPSMTVGLTFLPDCNPATSFPLSDPNHIMDGGDDPCSMSAASWDFTQSG